MRKERIILAAKFAPLLLAIPVFIYADSGGAGTSGTDAGYSGVPGEQGSCAACHSSGSGSGSVTVTFPNGPFYTPGTSQILQVTVSDTPQRAWGYQLTARPASSSSTQAGTFVQSDSNSQVVCAQADFKKEQFYAPCPSSMPLMYIEHSVAGTGLPAGQRGPMTFQFQWTPPSSDVGPINVYVSSVAANGDGTTSGDHVYNARYTLTRLQPNQPIVNNTNGVVNGASFTGTVSPGSWVTIQGVSLANSTRPWAAGDFVNGNLPTSLDGVSVTMDNKPAYVAYISPKQLNVQAPSNTAQGAINVVVTNNGLVSNTSTVVMQTAAPAFFLWNGKYAVATRPDFSLAAPANLFPGVTTVPAKPNDVIILWCAGLGATTPAVAAGILSPSNPVANVTRLPTVLVGGVGAQVLGAALAPGFAGLYQVSVQIPNSLGDGDQLIVLQSGSASSPTSGVYLTIQH